MTLCVWWQLGCCISCRHKRQRLLGNVGINDTSYKPMGMPPTAIMQKNAANAKRQDLRPVCIKWDINGNTNFDASMIRRIILLVMMYPCEDIPPSRQHVISENFLLDDEQFIGTRPRSRCWTSACLELDQHRSVQRVSSTAPTASWTTTWSSDRPLGNHASFSNFEAIKETRSRRRQVLRSAWARYHLRVINSHS